MEPFSYLGDRDYILVADIIDSIVIARHGNLLYPLGLDVNLQSKCQHAQIRLLENCPENEDLLTKYSNEGLASYLEPVSTGNTTRFQALVIADGEPASIRRADDEKIQATHWPVSKNEKGQPEIMVQALPMGWSLVHTLTAAFKKLLHESSLASHRLLFARIVFNAENQALNQGFTLRYSRKMGTFYEGHFEQDGLPKGRIYFL